MDTTTARYTVWSPYDGNPIPAPNEVERDVLLAQGYLAEPPPEPEPPAEDDTPDVVDQVVDPAPPKEARRDRGSVRADSAGVPAAEES